MKCPKCDNNLPKSVSVEMMAIVFQFGMTMTGGQWRRETDITAVEMSSPDMIKEGSHFFTCPSCREKVDLSTVQFTPTCARCSKEKAKMTQAENHCHYEGLVCLECAKAGWTGSCATCSHLSKCALGKRARPSKPTEE